MDLVFFEERWRVIFFSINLNTKFRRKDKTSYYRATLTIGILDESLFFEQYNGYMIR